MPASSSPPPYPHRIAILLSPAGRFLQCRDCERILSFPNGTQFSTIAKQVESHSCGSQIYIPGSHSDRRFVISRYESKESKVPAMASYAKWVQFLHTTIAGARRYWRGGIPGTQVRCR